MATKKLHFSMAYKTMCGWLLGLLFVGVIFVASGTWAKCSDQTFNSACICLDDIECVTSLDVLEPTVCKCHDLGDVSLEGLVEVLKETSGVVDALHISGHEMTSLEPLAGLLKEVQHSIVILNTTLQSLKLLSGLKTVGKSLSMVENKFLRNVDGLGNITQVNGSLQILSNAALSDVDGLGNVTQVNGDLRVESNAALSDVDGLGNVTQVNGSLQIVSNAALSDVEGLGSITQVNGRLDIWGNDNLSDVDGLGNVTQVNGSLWIVNNAVLSDVDGLGNINQVNGNLRIESNAALSDVDGLGNVTQVNGDLWIGANDNLSDVDGLGDITQVNGSLQIVSNAALSDVNGLGNITQVNGGLWIKDNVVLLDVDGLGSITRVNGDLHIESNDALLHVNGLSNIAQVDGALWIEDNAALSDVNGLGNITQVNGDLRIESNAALSHVDGLGNITQVKGSLQIVSNVALSDVEGLGNVTQVSGRLDIWGNDNLSDVDGMGNVTQVNGNLRIESNAALSDVDGLGNVTLVDGDLWIGGNDNLSDVDGLGNITQVNGGLWIVSNAALSDVNGLGNITQVNGGLWIQDNAALLDVNGLGNITQVNGDLHIESNDALWHVNGLGNITQVNGGLWIEDNAALSDVNGLGNITQVNGDLHIEGNGALFDVNGLGNITQVNGDLRIQNNAGLTTFSMGILALPSLVNIGGSLVLEGNFLSSLSFSNLQAVCFTAIGRCGLTIHNNAFVFGPPDLSTFNNLRGNLNGHVSIMSNRGLVSIQGFDSLISLRGDKGPREIDRFVDGLTISSNPDLENVDGFGSLARVEGDVEIDNNENLQYVSLKSLAVVDGTTRITSNGVQIEDFVSSDALPYRQGGCRKWENMSPMSSAFVVSERLVRKVCVLETLTPTLVGFAIIGMLVVISLLLLYYLAVTINSPYKERISLDTMKDMFASHLLALADVLSDVGFIVTVFILWDSKSKKGVAGGDFTQDGSYTELLAIGVASIVVVVVSQLSTVFLVYWGLRTKHADENGNGEKLSLMDYLKEGKHMQTHDWLLLFPGLLLLDVEIIKHLPWGEELKVDGKRVVANGGMPHKHFAWAAYLAALLEDLPQVALQVAFIIVIEEDDGWAITGAMASLTLSVADAMVKLVFPPILEQLMGHQRGMKRAKAMARRCECCGQLLPEKEPLEVEENAEK